jgi:hypothetical protein
MKRTVVLISLAMAAACGGRADAGADVGASGAGTGGGSQQFEATGGASGSTAVVSAAGTATATWAGAAADVPQPPREELICPTQEPRNSQVFASPAAKAQALVGWWLQCSQQGIGPDDAVGIAIASDGVFTILVRDADGSIVPGAGVLHEGRVELAQNEVRFVFPGITELTSMLFSDEVPYRMYAFNTDFIGYDYVR